MASGGSDPEAAPQFAWHAALHALLRVLQLPPVTNGKSMVCERSDTWRRHRYRSNRMKETHWNGLQEQRNSKQVAPIPSNTTPPPPTRSFHSHSFNCPYPCTLQFQPLSIHDPHSLA